jgi:hypothetical protein
MLSLGEMGDIKTVTIDVLRRLKEQCREQGISSGHLQREQGLLL